MVSLRLHSSLSLRSAASSSSELYFEQPSQQKQAKQGES